MRISVPVAGAKAVGLGEGRVDHDFVDGKGIGEAMGHCLEAAQIALDRAKRLLAYGTEAVSP